MKDMSKLQSWVAKPYDKPSKVLDCGFEDPDDAQKYIDELGAYLPSISLDYAVIQRLMLDEDDQPCIYQEGSGNWSNSMLHIMGQLRMRLEKSPNGYILVDMKPDYDAVQFPIASGWSITRWELRVIPRPDSDDLLCDFVTWSKGKVSTVTFHGWKIY